MNEKIGMYTEDEILEHLTEGEGRGFLGRSMYDAIFDKIHVLKTENEQLKQENKQLKEQVQDLKADYGTIAQIERDLYKEVIEEVRKYTKKEIREYKYAIDETTMDSDTEDIYDMAIRNFEKLLQILDKVKD